MSTSGVNYGVIVAETICSADREDGTPCPWVGEVDVHVDLDSNRAWWLCGCDDPHDNEGYASDVVPVVRRPRDA